MAFTPVAIPLGSEVDSTHVGGDLTHVSGDFIRDRIRFH